MKQMLIKANLNLSPAIVPISVAAQPALEGQSRNLRAAPRCALVPPMRAPATVSGGRTRRTGNPRLRDCRNAPVHGAALDSGQLNENITKR